MPTCSRARRLGLTATVGELVSLNQQIKHLIDLRNNDLAQVTPQAMLQARAASDDAYALIVAIINALAVADWAYGSSHYDQAVARINQDQDYYLKNVFAKGKGGASTGTGGTEGTENPGTTTEPGTTDPGTNTDPTTPGGGGTTTDPTTPGSGGSDSGGSGSDSGGGGSDPDPDAGDGME